MFARIAVVVASTALAVPLLAGAVSAEPSQQACFGQARAAGVAAGLEQGLNWGSQVDNSASDRKGTNAANNAAYREACQSAN